MITLSTASLVVGILVGLLTILGIVFSIYLYFRNPQVKTEKDIIELKGKINDTIADLQKEIVEIKQTHLRNVESDIKKLNDSIAVLNIAVAKLTTIIDERIPKAEKHAPML